MDILSNLFTVLLVAIILGAGLPMLFAIGVRLEATGNADGKGTTSSGAKFLAYIFYALCLAAIIAGLLWITNDTIAHYTGLDIYGTASKK